MSAMEKRQDLIELYTSIEGRVGRKVWWLYYFLPVMAFFFVIEILSISQNLKMLLQAAFVFPSVVIQIKRWHDLNKSGWWALIVFIPLIGVIYAIAMHGFVRGTDGSNQYGEKPNDN
jgi:uncharacterized membrane protein YhaH (DUF805 family)